MRAMQGVNKGPHEWYQQQHNHCQSLHPAGTAGGGIGVQTPGSAAHCLHF